MNLVSIIVPIFNVEKYLEKCIQSLIKQTYTNLEIILVDDGSTDSSSKICDFYSQYDSRIVVLHKNNGGLSDARNEGLSKVTGKYVMFVDGDDYLELSAVEKLIDIFNVNKDLDLIYFEFNLVYEKKNLTIKNNSNISMNKFSFLEYPEILCKSVSAWNKIYRNDFLKKNHFSFPLNRYCEDLYTIPCVYPIAQKIYYLDSALYNYVQRPGSIIRSGKTQKLCEDRKVAIENIFEEFSKLKLTVKYKEELEFLKYYHTVYFPILEIIKCKGNDEHIFKILEDNKTLIKEIKSNKYLNHLKKNEKIISKLIFFKLFSLIKILYRIKGY